MAREGGLYIQFKINTPTPTTGIQDDIKINEPQKLQSVIHYKHGGVTRKEHFNVMAQLLYISRDNYLCIANKLKIYPCNNNTEDFQIPSGIII